MSHGKGELPSLYFPHIASQTLEEDFSSVEATNGEVVPVVSAEPVEPAARLPGRRGRRSLPVATVARTRKDSSCRIAGA